MHNYYSRKNYIYLWHPRNLWLINQILFVIQGEFYNFRLSIKKLKSSVYIFLLCFLSHFVFAQKKDSAAIKAAEKEPFLKTRKRDFTYIVSDRLSRDDKFDIFKITPTDEPPFVIIVRGHFEMPEDPKQKVVRITVYNASNKEKVGLFVSNAYTGNYILVLVANVKYIFNVEVPGYGHMQEEVEVPLKIDYEICRQNMIVKLNEKRRPVLTVNSYFNDEHEKMFYIKSSGDTVRTLADPNEIAIKNAKGYSTIDELVKKQVEEENKKPVEALKAFKSGDFETAASLYEALLKNDPADPFNNYYYGVSLFKLNRNKAKCISALQLASGYQDVPNDAHLYLARAFHQSYIFQDAMAALEDYKKRATPAELASPNYTQLLSYCKNGAALMSDPVNIEVMKRVKIQDENILGTYNSELINERLMYKTDFFKTPIDKKKSSKLLVTNYNKHEYVQVSYGPKEQNNTDLYKNVMMPNNALSPAQSLGADINTPFDEDYPYLSKDGLTLYFSSKGHNSMGGFDIFKCTRPDVSSPWSKPENLGYPINSTYDDVLFVPDTVGKYASYCSNRKGTVFELIQVRMPEGNPPPSVIKGGFSVADSLGSREAILSVYNSNTGEIAGVYRTNPQTGLYLMILASGTKYDLTVSADGYPDLNSSFEVPTKRYEFTLKQKIFLKKLSDKNPLVINNYFREEEASKVSFDVPASVKGGDGTVGAKPEKKRKERSAEDRKKDEEELQLARKLFDESNFQEAAIVYEQLERHLDLDALNSYYYGIALYKTRGDKNDCAKALEVAANGKGVPMDVHYYLGKSYHLNYRFTDAIKSYNKFASLCKPDETAKYNLAREIEYCNNGIQLVNNPVVMEVHDRKHVDVTALQNQLTKAESGAKILVLTEDMRSVEDKKRNHIPLLYLSPDKNTLIYSSYGEDGKNGKDIYRLKKLSNGKWSPVPENLTWVNTPADEEFPALSKDGKTLYFSSKGYVNMGGYDIFKSVFNEETNEWSKPVNMGSPINSPYDDIYFLE